MDRLSPGPGCPKATHYTQLRDRSAPPQLPPLSGRSIADVTRRSAVYIDKIRKGTPAGELSIEQPAEFDMTINIKVAKALGLTIPSRCCCARTR